MLKSACIALTAIALVSVFCQAEPSPKAAEYAAAVRVKPLLQATTTASGQPIQYPTTDRPEVRMLMVEIPPGTETGWHKHPSHCYAYVVSGAVTVELENGKSTTIKAGQAYAEVFDTWHNGKNSGTEPCKILMVVNGEEGVPISQMRQK